VHACAERGATTTFFHNATPKHQNNVSIFLNVLTWSVRRGLEIIPPLSPEKKKFLSLHGACIENAHEVEEPLKGFLCEN
jgi:hypothetical protein